MIWNNLKNGKCPKCSGKLVMGLLDIIYPCSSCDFKIGKEKFESIAFGKPAKRCEWPEEQNLAELNNLGHNVVTEDYSDSPYKN